MPDDRRGILARPHRPRAGNWKAAQARLARSRRNSGRMPPSAATGSRSSRNLLFSRSVRASLARARGVDFGDNPLEHFRQLHPKIIAEGGETKLIVGRPRRFESAQKSASALRYPDRLATAVNGILG